jgi:hypothetical protein
MSAKHDPEDPRRKLTDRNQPIQQQHSSVRQRYIVPQDRIEVVIGAERVHNVVDNIVTTHAAGKPIHVQPITGGFKIGGCMPELPPHKRACNASLVVPKELSETRVRVSDAGDEAAIVEGQVLDRFKNQFGWDTG